MTLTEPPIRMATTTSPPSRTTQRTRRPPQPPPIVPLFSGDSQALLRQVRRDLDIRHQPQADELVAAFMDEVGLVPGAACKTEEVIAVFASFVRLVATAVIRDATRATEDSAPLPGRPVTPEDVEEAQQDDHDGDDGDDGEAQPTVKGTSVRKSTSTKKPKPPAHDPIEERRKALAASFFTGVDWVTWGTATVEEHDARAAYLGRKVDGLNATIDKHLEAIALIEADPTATCLNDLETVFTP